MVRRAMDDLSISSKLFRLLRDFIYIQNHTPCHCTNNLILLLFVVGCCCFMDI